MIDCGVNINFCFINFCFINNSTVPLKFNYWRIVIEPAAGEKFDSLLEFRWLGHDLAIKHNWLARIQNCLKLKF